MRALASYVMSGHIQAAGIIGLFGILAAWKLPFLTYLSSAALGLVVLRHGPRDGILVMLGGLLLCGSVAYVGFGSPLMAFAMAVVVWLPVWLLAQVLRTTQTQTLLLIAAGGMLVVLAVGVRAYMTDIDIFWQDWLEKATKEAFTDSGQEASIEAIKKMAFLMNGFLISALGITIVLSVMLARWWQSLLYNPGGFGEEFRRIKLPAILSVVLVGLALIILLTKGQLSINGLLVDCLMIAMLVFLFHGLSVVHYFVKQKGLGTGWLIGLYFFMLMVPTSLYAVLATVLTGVFDSVADFRKLRSQTP